MQNHVEGLQRTSGQGAETVGKKQTKLGRKSGQMEGPGGAIEL